MKVKVVQSCWTLCNPMEFSRNRILEWVAFAFSRDLPNPGIKPRSPTLQADIPDEKFSCLGQILALLLVKE